MSARVRRAGMRVRLQHAIAATSCAVVGMPVAGNKYKCFTNDSQMIHKFTNDSLCRMWRRGLRHASTASSSSATPGPAPPAAPTSPPPCSPCSSPPRPRPSTSSAVRAPLLMPHGAHPHRFTAGRWGMPLGTAIAPACSLCSRPLVAVMGYGLHRTSDALRQVGPLRGYPKKVLTAWVGCTSGSTTKLPIIRAGFEKPRHRGNRPDPTLLTHSPTPLQRRRSCSRRVGED